MSLCCFGVMSHHASIWPVLYTLMLSTSSLRNIPLYKCIRLQVILYPFLQVQEMLEDTEIVERLKSMRKYATDPKADFPIPPQQPPTLSPEYSWGLKSWVDETNDIVLSR